VKPIFDKNALMLTKEFYERIDEELDVLLTKYQDDPFIVNQKKAINNQKSYALLIWFLEFYGRISNYSDFITDGENDSSCDIVFDNIDTQGQRIFYVVQSKWNNADNAEKNISGGEISKALSDFQTILRGGKSKINKRLQEKLDQLDEHQKHNGEVKFIFLSLAQYKGGVDDSINSFRENDPKTKFEVIDINRIKADYIDRKFKKIEPINPLEYFQNPEESPVSLEFVQKNGNFIKIEKPFEAYLVLLRPKMIFELFEKYGFALFYKNVRNPLLQSQFNEQIEQTALENPAFFWYYNNGITAITYMLPAIGKNAVKVELTGLQIINGAQTVYSIYRVYKRASVAKRAQMDGEALVTLRLLKSGGKDFDLNVTRFTNSQNPVNDRDFCANDDVQILLQNASYQTKVWYEKRQDEFRETPDGISKVTNTVLANLYLAFHLQLPDVVYDNYNRGLKSKKDLLFITNREHENGLYDLVFNPKTSFEDMLCVYYVFDAITATNNKDFDFYFKNDFFYNLALCRITIEKYLHAKFESNLNINQHIVRFHEQGDVAFFKDVYNATKKFADKNFSLLTDVKSDFRNSKVPGRFEMVKERLLKVSIKDLMLKVR
jgi:AIPR protein